MDSIIVVYYIDTRGKAMYIYGIDYIFNDCRFTANKSIAQRFDYQQARAACEWLRDNGYSDDPQARIPTGAWSRNIKELYGGAL